MRKPFLLATATATFLSVTLPAISAFACGNWERRTALGAAVAAVVFAAYWYLSSRVEPLPPRPTATGPAAVVERFECYRCHDAAGFFEAAHREESCVKCHQAVFAGDLDGAYYADAIAEWKEHIVHLTEVPTLTGIDQRFRRDWLVAFLQAPHDLRPGLDATMPRFRMSAAEAEEVASFFIPEEVDHETSEPGDVERGRALFEARDCAQCHHYTGSGVEARADHDDARLAPDLRFTRERMTRAAVLRWLSGPQEIKPDTSMPPPDLDAPEGRDVAAFIMDATLLALTPVAVPQRLPVLQRRVTHAEVDRRVFHRLCRHCHAEPTAHNRGDGGPGNTGGFGFTARGVDLSSFEAMQRMPELFEPDESGLPLLVAAMWRRHEEVVGITSERRGMPLGLPPMSLEEIQLVETWIAQRLQR